MGNYSSQLGMGKKNKKKDIVQLLKMLEKEKNEENEVDFIFEQLGEEGEKSSPKRGSVPEHKDEQ